MSTGDFIDSGYTISVDAFNSDGINIKNSKQLGLNIIDAVNTCGVFLLDGSKSDFIVKQLYCSGNAATLGTSTNIDDGYLVYPDWGVQLFGSNDASSTSSDNYSYIYYNTSNIPRVFGLSGGSFASTTSYTQIMYANKSNTYWPVNSANSWRIYYRNKEIKIPGLSEKGSKDPF